MPPRTPDFWYRAQDSAPSLEERMLAPVSALYQIGHKLKLSRTQTQAAPLPVICVGNLTAGGSGKTPVCIALNKLIAQNDIFKNAYFLTRGYGGDETAPRRIEVHDDALTVGDEPLLLLSHSNTIISKNRYEGAMYAHDLGADCVIMDDGLQNLTLKKDLSFLVVNGKMGFGNCKTLPSGPLREPVDFALPRIDAIIMIGEDERNVLSTLKTSKPVFSCDIQPIQNKEHDKDQKYIAFCGLGYPKKFYDTLKSSKYDVLETRSYSDHYHYENEDIEKLLNLAASLSAKLITTEKDYVKIPSEYKNKISVLPIEIVWNDETAITAFLKETVGNK